MRRVGVLLSSVVFFGLCLFPVISQAASGTGEKTVEDIYLQDSIEAMIIKDAIQSTNLQTREIGLQLIKQSLDNGKKSKEIYEALKDLSLESSKVITTEGGYGKPKYNFPLLRAKATEYLGMVGTEEAQATLIEVLENDKEPIVIAAAMYGLGTVKKNDGNKVSQRVARIFKGFHYTRPDDNMAMSLLICYEKVFENGQIKDPDAIEAVRLIMEGNYNPVVRAKAKSLYYQKILNNKDSQKK